MVTGKPVKPSKFARFVLYPIGGVIFLLILTVVLIFANGYRILYTNGKVELQKTGMLIVSSRPFDGLISLNGKGTKFKSGFYLLPTKISYMNPGSYDVQVSKSGYRTWKNRLTIKPNMVTWANYILLFAEKLNISKIDVPAGSQIAASTNGRHLLFADNVNGKFSLKSLDTNNLAVKDFWPQTDPAEDWLKAPQITSAEFSPGNDRVLLHVTNGVKTDYVIADASGNQSKLIQLNTNLKQDFTSSWWSATNNNEVYLYGAAGLYLVNINDSSLASPIATDIVSLDVDSSGQLFYVAKDAAGTHSVVKMNLNGSSKETLVSSVVPSKSYKLAYSTQNNLLSLLNNDTGELNVYYVGNANKKSSVKLSEGVTGMGWSKNGQFLFYYGKDFVKRYDWEKNKETVTSLSGNILKVSWYFDENHYLVNSDKNVYVIDYDGTNEVEIASAPNSSTLDLGNNNILYSIKNTQGVIEYYRYIAEF